MPKSKGANRLESKKKTKLSKMIIIRIWSTVFRVIIQLADVDIEFWNVELWTSVNSLTHKTVKIWSEDQPFQNSVISQSHRTKWNFI